MRILKIAALISIFSLENGHAEDLGEFKKDVEKIASRMIAEASQHARCFALASVSRDTLIAKLHHVHGTDVLEIEYFKEIAGEEMDRLMAKKPHDTELEMYAYERYNANCIQMHLGRPKK